jgi:hypothetical protein
MRHHFRLSRLFCKVSFTLFDYRQIGSGRLFAGCDVVHLAAFSVQLFRSHIFQPHRPNIAFIVQSRCRILSPTRTRTLLWLDAHRDGLEISRTDFILVVCLALASTMLTVLRRVLGTVVPILLDTILGPASDTSKAIVFAIMESVLRWSSSAPGLSLVDFGSGCRL